MDKACRALRYPDDRKKPQHVYQWNQSKRTGQAGVIHGEHLRDIPEHMMMATGMADEKIRTEKAIATNGKRHSMQDAYGAKFCIRLRRT